MSNQYNVGLDISALSPDFKEHALRGIGRYVFELKKFFDAHRTQTISVEPFRHEEFVPSGKLNAFIEKIPAGRQTIRQQILFPFTMSAKTKARFDILHFPAHMDAPSWSLRDYVITVLDLIPLVLADLYKADRPSWRYHLARWLEIRAIKNARHIIAISQHTADDVHRVLGIPREKISVTYLGVDPSFFERDPGGQIRVRAQYNIPAHAPYVLYVGGIDQRKNITGLVASFKRVVDAQKEKNAPLPLLVLAGRIKQDRQYPKLRKLLHEAQVTALTIETDFISDEDLRLLYQGASVFFFPSLYEGFGLPPLEAMASGAPVVSSNTSCMPEILGDAALLVDPNDYDACAKAILSVLQSPELARKLGELGVTQAKKFSWEQTGNRTLEIYRALQNESASALV